MDKVYLKKEIKADKPFEEHPNLFFGLIILGVSIWILASIFVMSYVPWFLVALVDAAVVAGVICWIVQYNQKTNLSKSEAFIKRDGTLYHIGLGYALENEVPVDGVNVAMMGVTGALNAARAEENIAKSGHIRAIRQQEETYSTYLDEILNGPKQRITAKSGEAVMAPILPKYVISYCKLLDPRLEKQDRDWIWISYINEYNGQRVTQKYRNAYDLEMLQ